MSAWGQSFGQAWGDSWGALDEESANAGGQYQFAPLPRRPVAIENDEALLLHLIQ